MRNGSARLIGACLCLGVVLACSDRDPARTPEEPRIGADESNSATRSDAEGWLEPADVTRANSSDFAHQPGRTDWSGGDAERGAALYMQACWICHGAAGKGRGPAAASLNPKPRDFREGRFYIDANANDETGEPIDLARVILVGAEPFGGSELMQAWHSVFSTEEVRDVVAYVLSLARGGEEPGSSG